MEQNKLKLEDALTIIRSRSLVPNIDGYYQLKVTSVVPYDNKFIIGLNGMTEYHLNEAKRLMKEGDYDKATNQSLSASIRSTDYIPSKGEFVKVYVAELTTKNNVTGRFVTSVTELKSGVTSKVIFDFDLEDIKVPNGEELVK